MSQESCLDCYREHIATSMVFEDESTISGDYTEHKWLAIGELKAACKECVKEYPILAQITREHYIRFRDLNIPVPTIELIQLANQIEEQEEKNQLYSLNKSDGEE